VPRFDCDISYDYVKLKSRVYDLIVRDSEGIFYHDEPNFKAALGNGDSPPVRARRVDVAGKQIALFKVGGKLIAIDNACKHQGGPLGDGRVDGTTVDLPLAWMGITTSREERIRWDGERQARSLPG